MLKDKKIVLCVPGGIAVYKAVDIVSRLKKLGANVFVVMTENATKFVTPLTFQSISNNPVLVEEYNDMADPDIKHIKLAQMADLFVIVPATANVIGKVANGIADDLVTSSIIATKAPVLIIPAMNTNMYENPIVQNNIEKLKTFGYLFLEPEIGTMAMPSETVGKGRLPEPIKVVEHIASMDIFKIVE